MNDLQNRKWVKSCAIIMMVLLIYSYIIPEFCLARSSRDRAFRVRQGDAIHIYVYDGFTHTEKNRFISTFHDKEYIIDGFGNIQLLSLGSIRVVGLRPKDIAELLQEKVSPFAKDPIVIVRPLIRLTLRGGFEQPGMYRFSLDTTIWDVIKEAGGLEEKIEIENMRLIRKDRMITAEFVNAIHNASSLYEIGITSGDIIYAPSPNKITFDTIMRYTQFAVSFLLIYLTVKNNERYY